MKKIKKGDIVFRKKSEILLLAFKRKIKMISTIHGAETVPTGGQENERGYSETIVHHGI